MFRVSVVFEQGTIKSLPFILLHILNQILDFTQPKSWEGKVFVMSHSRWSLPDVFFWACERDCSLLSSPGTDPPAVTCGACWCRFLNTFWTRRQSWLLSLTHTRPIPVAVVQTLKLQNKRKRKVQRGLRNVDIFTRWITTSQQPGWWKDGARMRRTRPNRIKQYMERERMQCLIMWIRWIGLKEEVKSGWYSPTKIGLGSLTSLRENWRSVTQLMSKRSCENLIILL